MKFTEFLRYRPSGNPNVVVFVCEDDFLVEESRSVWSRILGDNWLFEKLHAKEFEEIETNKLLDDAQTPSLFSQNRALIIWNADKVSKKRGEDLSTLHGVANSSLKVILVVSDLKTTPSWMKAFPTISIDPLKSADVTKWLMDRYALPPEIARHVVDSAGMELYSLHNEMEKLKTYLGADRAPTMQDVDASILRVEQFGRFELDDAILARDYKRAVSVIGAMLDDGEEHLLILSKIVRVWRQLFVGKGVSVKRGANEAAAAAGVPSFKASTFAASCRKYSWSELAKGFRELLSADRALKLSPPDTEAYFDVLLWKLVGGRA
jgi:DNA polymerase III delta subunit